MSSSASADPPGVEWFPGYTHDPRAGTPGIMTPRCRATCHDVTATYPAEAGTGSTWAGVQKQYLKRTKPGDNLWTILPTVKIV